MSAIPTSILTLSISLENVTKLDTFSQSDPFVVLSLNGHPIGRTEVLQNNPNPRFATTFNLPYYFEQQQLVEIAAYDADSDDLNDLSKHDEAGKAVVSLAQLVQEAVSTVRLRGKNAGQCVATLSVEPLPDCGTFVTFDFLVSGLGKGLSRLLGGKYSLAFERTVEPSGSVRVYRSPPRKVGKHGLHVVEKLPLAKLCAADRDRTLFIDVLRIESGGAEVRLGRAETTVKELMLTFENQGKIATLQGNRVAKPVLSVRGLSEVREPTFADFLRGGLDLQLHGAIDFTASNGAPSDPRSLHHASPTAPTPYHEALASVGGILMQYDSDQVLPLYGFGAKVPSNGYQPQVSHLFKINEGSLDEGIAAYYQTLQTVELYGPTNFAPFVHYLIDCARQNPSSFHVGLIITDGVISDFQRTVNGIVEASHLPIALVIVGVGSADFSSMDQLDCDEGVLTSSNGAQMEADIVQFVPFNECRGRLAQAVLEELPGQVENYFKRKNILPRSPMEKPREIVEPIMAPVYCQ